MLRLPVSVALLAALALPALAAGWSSFENTFPALPCQDGWAGCVVDGSAMGPGAQKDAAGRPLAADARIGWFDLKPTSRLSPFVSLSAYSGPIGQVAVAETPPPPETPPPVETNNGGGDAVADAGPPPTTRPVSDVPPTTSNPSSNPTNAVVTTYSPTTTTTTTSSGGMRPNSPSNPNTTTTAPTTTTTTTTATTATTTTSGGMRPNSPSSTTTTTTAVQPVSSTPTTTTTTVAAVNTSAGDNSCDDLVKLEPAAMMGQLSSGQAGCLEKRIGSESQQTTKDKVSRLMIANAENKGDKAEWERLIKRHLEDIDRSDPDLCFKYALHLSRGGVGRAPGVIRWADYALENKAKWSGSTYKSRVFNLYKLRAEAANKLWQDAEKNYMETDHSEENEAKAAKYRGQAKDYAREWLDYAKASEQDTKTAMALCVSSSGNRAFCEGG